MSLSFLLDNMALPKTWLRKGIAKHAIYLAGLAFARFFQFFARAESYGT
jgi:hypothetical protein